MKLKRVEVLQLFDGLNTLQNLKGAKFAYMCAKNKEILRGEVTATRAAYMPSDKMKEYEGKRIALCEKYADKDDNEKAVIINGSYSLVMNKAVFDKELKKLTKDYKETIDENDGKIAEYKKFLEEEIEPDLVSIDLEDVPKEITGRQMDVIIKLVIDKPAAPDSD